MLPTYNSLRERVRFLKVFLFEPILKVCNFHIQCYFRFSADLPPISHYQFEQTGGILGASKRTPYRIEGL